MKKTVVLLLACCALHVSAQADVTPVPDMHAAIQAQRDGRYDEALRLVRQQFARIGNSDRKSQRDYGFTIFVWGQLVDESAAARTAMMSERDEQVRRLLDGDATFCSDGYMPLSRFHVIVDLNRILRDERATYRLVSQLLADNPTLVGKELYLALPAIVDAGDYALAVQHIKDPLSRLPSLNRLALELPLFPDARTPPRLAAELSIFMGEVALLSKSLTGLGREAEAKSLRQAALTGLQSAELRALASRELNEPGAITQAIVDHQMNEGLGKN